MQFHDHKAGKESSAPIPLRPINSLPGASPSVVYTHRAFLLSNQSGITDDTSMVDGGCSVSTRGHVGDYPRFRLNHTQYRDDLIRLDEVRTNRETAWHEFVHLDPGPT